MAEEWWGDVPRVTCHQWAAGEVVVTVVTSPCGSLALFEMNMERVFRWAYGCCRGLICKEATVVTMRVPTCGHGTPVVSPPSEVAPSVLTLSVVRSSTARVPTEGVCFPHQPRDLKAPVRIPGD